MKPKRMGLIILSFLIILIAIKIYFEFDCIIFNNKIEQMDNNNKLTVKVNSPVEHKTLKMDGYEIHYYVSGKENDDLIIFLHPAFSDHRAFDQQIDFFSSKYRVITVDLIGHGLSKARKSKDKIDASSMHIQKIIEVEGGDKVHLVGVSMGALIAQYFALNHPDKVNSLTALGGYNINSQNVQKTQQSVILSLIFRALFSMDSFRRKAAEMSCKSKRGQVLFYKTADSYERKSFLVMQGLQNIVKTRENLQPKYPIFILTGAYDIDLAKKMAKEWHSETVGSKYDIIDNAGHCANIDRPLVFNEKVKEFIDESNK